MKKSKGIGLLFLGVLLILLIAVPGAQAREILPVDGYTPTQPDASEKATAKVYDPEQFSGTWGITPDLLMNCDPSGDLLTKVEPGNVQTSHKLQTAACQKQASIDAAEAAKQNSAALKGGLCSFNAVSGESNMVKVNPVFTETRYVYLQCGKKVAEFGPPSCSCGGSWRYTYSCKKPPTVYITIPCH